MDAIAEMQERLKVNTPNVQWLTSAEIFAVDNPSIPVTGKAIQEAFLKKNGNFASPPPEPLMEQVGWLNTKYGTYFKVGELANARLEQLIATGELIKVYAPQKQEAKDGN
jgi:hypothetical protein